MPAMEGVGESQTTWKNTLAAFKRQFTQIDKLMADAKACSENLKDPRHEMDAKEARKLVGPIQHKLGLITKYVDSLHAILPLAAVTEDEAGWSVNALSASLEQCMDRTTTGNQDLRAFLDDIEEWEAIHTKKEPKSEETRTVSGGGTGGPRAPELKGVVTALKPVELTSSIQAHDMSAWVEQWTEFKENSAFSKQGEKSIIAYLKTCVSRDILSAIDYKSKNTEKEMLDAIRVYLDMKVHPKVIRQLKIW